MSDPTLNDLIDLFVDEWTITTQRVAKAVEAKDLSSLSDLLPMVGLKPHSFVSRKANQYLSRAAGLLLTKQRLDLRVSAATARSAIVAAFSSHLEQASKSGLINDRAIIDGANARLQCFSPNDGVYVIAARIAPLARKSNFRIGPVRIVSKVQFLREYAKSLRKEWPDRPDSHRFLLKRWITHLKDYDHLVLVEMNGFETEMAWKMSRECAEFALNLMRMTFRFRYTSRLRLEGDFNPTLQSSSAVIGGDGYVWFSAGWASRSSMLDDRWQDVLDQNLGAFAFTLATYVGWLASGTHSGNPITERLRYAHMLIAEAYCEPSDHLRLVRLISALETLALVDGNDKAHQLAMRCACAGGWGDPERANSVFDRTKAAYYWRNAVVHGDAPPASEVTRAFVDLEEHLLEIVVGFMVLFARIATSTKPQSVKPLRRELKKRIELFFWAPGLFEA